MTHHRVKGGFEISIKDPDKSLPFIQNTINIDVSSSMINLNLQHKIYILTMVIIFLTIVQLKTEIINIISYLISKAPLLYYP